MASASLALVRPGSDLAGARPAAAPAGADQRLRLVDGALACIARFGLAKTTLDDVARAAGCSRATLYRVFPGGKDALLQAVVDTEVARLFSELALSMARAEDLHDVLVAGMTGAARAIEGHEALTFLLAHEPEVVLPHLTFDHHDRLLEVVGTYAAPFLGRWLEHEEAARVARWAARIVLSYVACPADDLDLAEPSDVAWLVRNFVLPAAGEHGRQAGTTEEPRAMPAPVAAHAKSLTKSVTGDLSKSKGEAS